jgi:putative ABC transport system ATP-binding protein
VRALDGVDLTVAPGEFVAIMGPSGSGKSTLLSLLGALDTPTAGEVWVDGKAVSTLTELERTMVRRTRIGFVFQQFNLVPYLTALENVALPLVVGRTTRDQRAERARRALEAVGLAERADEMPTRLSGGEQQRVAIARALVHEPAVVLADEPTGNLDSATGLAVMETITQVREQRGHAVVLVTHDERIASLADRIVRLRDGRVDHSNGA